MTPSARLAAAIEILDALDQTAKPADRFLRDYFRARRYAGSKDRAAIGERVYAILRHRASLSFRMGGTSPRALVIASLLREGLDRDAIAGLFTGAAYAPAALSAAETDAVLNPPAEAPPLAVRGEFPQFLEAELARAFGDEVLAEMQAMQARAPIDLRVNTLKAAREDVLAELRSSGFDAEPLAGLPFGLRLPPGAGASTLRRLPAYEAGHFEFQDAAAQEAAWLLGAKPGERILDVGAGAGGKSLAFAAAMQNKGEIVACDIRAEALAELEARAARAGTNMIRTCLADDLDDMAFDAVFVDAPCSGSGTWRRQPELKWRLTPARLAELGKIQDDLLDVAASRVRPGGCLVYATCSILPCENEDRASAFLARRRDFHVADPARRDGGERPLLRFEQCFRRFSPRRTHTDGFFVEFFVKSESPVVVTPPRG